jgi:hypothetical protein
MEGSKTFLIVLTPNYRRGVNYKFTQYLTAVTEVKHNGGFAFDLSIKKKENGRISIDVLSDNGVRQYLLPEAEDLLF